MPFVVLWGSLAWFLFAPMCAADVYRLGNGAHYTDHLPPERVQEGYTVLDKQGREVRRLPPAATPEELEAERRKAAAKREKQRLEEAQAKRDAVLLQLYASEDAIRAAREARLESLASRRVVLVGQVQSMRQRLALLEREDPQSDEIPRLHRRLAEYEETERLLLRERQAEMARFDADLERWRYLKQTGARPVVKASPKN